MTEWREVGRAARRAARTIEWPTLAVAAAIYGGFAALTWHYHALPWWLAAPLGAYLVAWHGSLQHEALHGHPTPWPALNEALVFPGLWLWMPYRVYRDLHLRHHDDAYLTDPLEDPESFYVSAQAWARCGPVARAALWAHNTLAGRLLLGPLFCVWRLGVGELGRLVRGEPGARPAWAAHLAGCALVLGWTVGVCGIPVLEYLALFVYPALSLTLLRSFLEHQARPTVDERTALVEAGPVMSLLYLNNNLHALHHLEPGTPWYRLPARYRLRRAELVRRNHGYVLRGYAEVAARYLLRPKESPVHAFAPGPGAVPPPNPTSAPLAQTQRAV